MSKRFIFGIKVGNSKVVLKKTKVRAIDFDMLSSAARVKEIEKELKEELLSCNLIPMIIFALQYDEKEKRRIEKGETNMEWTGCFRNMKRINGGIECDNPDGACACGAWHIRSEFFTLDDRWVLKNKNGENEMNIGGSAMNNYKINKERMENENEEDIKEKKDCSCDKVVDSCEFLKDALLNKKIDKLEKDFFKEWNEKVEDLEKNFKEQNKRIENLENNNNKKEEKTLVIEKVEKISLKDVVYSNKNELYIEYNEELYEILIQLGYYNIDFNRKCLSIDNYMAVCPLRKKIRWVKKSVADFLLSGCKKYKFYKQSLGD